MKKTAISVTEASRNFADCVNRVRYQNASFVLEKNGEPVAELVPSQKKACTGAELAKILAKVRLSAEERQAWQKDLDEGRKMLLPPVDKWK
jgi:prevent-host-death family protein